MGLGSFLRGAGLAMLLAVHPAHAEVDATPLDPECSVPDAMLKFAGGALDLIEALRSGGPVQIVALGSSSTEGAGVDSPDLSYPSRLQAELAKRFPGQEIRVVNRGIGGQLARQMLARLKRDVIDEKPDLVIWQTGTNEALTRTDPQDFAVTIEEGIERLDAAGIDVMLMDLQYFPTVRNPEAYQRYVTEMSAIAAREVVPLFPRFSLMRYWSGRHPQGGSALWASDQFHLGALGYKCVAAVLAELIEREVHGHRHATALSRTAGTIARTNGSREP